MTIQPLQPLGGVFSDLSLSALNANLNELYGRVLGVGNVFICDYLNGSDATGDGSAAKPFKTLAQAYNSTVSGHNDVVVIIGNGATTASQRLSAALSWSNNCTHLIGINPPNMHPWARIAPTSGATAFTPLMTIGGTGCMFANIEFWHGFATGTTSQILFNITGNRNFFKNCFIGGIGDAASAASAGSRCVKFTAGEENLFEDCAIGTDTVQRTAACATLEFASGAARNVFRRCVFPFWSSDGAALGYIGSAASSLDRYQLFDRCQFINAVKSTGTALAGLGTLAANTGGLLVFDHCTLVGISEFGTDATTRAFCYVNDGTVTAATSSIAVNPT